jgi:hypothetical protein
VVASASRICTLYGSRTVSMCMSPPLSNHWLQARPGCALLFVPAPRPGLPEPKR